VSVSSEAVFDRLAPFIREFIHNQAWQDLRPIQIEAAEAILDTDSSEWWFKDKSDWWVNGRIED